MTLPISLADRRRGAIFGMFIGDALAMPVHWYYDTQALQRDYGKITSYLKPRNPHPDSILWRSSFSSPNGVADILHDQRQYWGVKDIHYHQFLHAGENTLNVKLAKDFFSKAWYGIIHQYILHPQFPEASIFLISTTISLFP